MKIQILFLTIVLNSTLSGATDLSFLERGRIDLTPRALYTRAFNTNGSKAALYCATGDTNTQQSFMDTHAPINTKPEVVLAKTIPSKNRCVPAVRYYVPKCSKGWLVEAHPQGISPLMTIRTESTRSMYNVYEVSQNRCVDFEAHLLANELVVASIEDGAKKFSNYPNRVQAIYSANRGVADERPPYNNDTKNAFASEREYTLPYQYKPSIENGNVNVTIDLLKVLASANKMVVRMSQSLPQTWNTGDLQNPLNDDNYYVNDVMYKVNPEPFFDHISLVNKNTNSSIPSAAVAWEGIFTIERCELATPLAMDYTQRINSLSELVENGEKYQLPGYTSCILKADKMTTDTLGAWNEKRKMVVPNLSQVSMQITSRYADITYTAMNKKYEVRRVMRRESGGTESTDAQALALAENLIELLKGSIPYIVQDNGQQALPRVAGYFHTRRAEIQANVKELEALLKSESTSVVTVFNILIGVNKTYRDLDQAVGLASNRFVDLKSLIQVQPLN